MAEMSRRDEARKASMELQEQYTAEGQPLGWFEALYAQAGGDPESVPWAKAAPRGKLRQWLAENPSAQDGGDLVKPRAIDIGCGLGDNAEIIAAAGWTVTAFDLSPTAAEWAERRFPDSGVSYVAADLFNPPAEWLGAFDLVHETYTLQALPQEMLGLAMERIAALVRPGGVALVMTRARDLNEVRQGPPRPVAREELSPFLAAGLYERRFEEFYDDSPEPVRHFLVEYVKPHLLEYVKAK
jgi:2-polyprenyl-3-methyl-5-hydroxy-6-metoxy-1,4-benzoquinol methylase